MALRFNKNDAEQFNKLINAAGFAVGELREFMIGVIEHKRDELSNRTEEWREGDKGQAVEAWLDAWDSFVDELPEFDTWPEMSPE